MNRHDRDRSRPEHLSDILHTLADSAAETHAGRTPEAMLATARRHGLAARRRQTRSRALVAAASVAAIAVGGVVIAQNIGGATVPPPPASQTPSVDPAAAFPACGATVGELEHTTGLRLATDAYEEADGGPAVSTPAGASPVAVQSIDDIFEVTFTNQGDSALSVGSTGYSAFVLVRDGVVVGATDAMPEPYRQENLSPGDHGEPLERAGIAMCDGPESEVAGEYDVYSYVDATVTDAASEGAAPTSARVWGGPWKLRVGPTVGGSQEPALSCAMPTSEITAPDFPQMNGKPVVLAEVTPPQDALPIEDVVRRKVRLDVSSVTGDTYFGDDVEVYLIRDGKVVSTRVTSNGEDPWYVGSPDAWRSTVEETGATPAEAFFPEISGVDCQTGQPLAAGEYEMLVVARMWVPDYEFTVFAQREHVTLGDAPVLPKVDPLAVFPECAAAVPGYSDTALTLGEPGETFVNGDAATEIAVDLINEDERVSFRGKLGKAIQTVLTLDGRVVGEVRTTTLEEVPSTVDLGPGGSAKTAAGFSTQVCGSAEPLPAGTYEVWAQLEVTPEGGSSEVSIGRLGSVRIS
ncbi:hypothetical protein ATL41_2002 [Flavimobilis soli]|uniref:Uncharacterized protein n=1 Tax=Flavimobilis soli TaxID=442709 RepID=A0A2A9EEA2_9MICO|nr:hypothetical protein [Flavimobilis soli]PFG37248.1 hypothetical protein ATL41_2002 [Flavimobilis soli]